MATTKKSKNVPAPIDERETFVSLQKNFAEDEQGVHDKLRALYELQSVDNEIDKLIHLRGELPSEVKTLEDELDALKSKSARIEQIIGGYNSNIEAAKQEIVDLDSEIEKYRSQLENISNSREYDSINKELENLGLLRAIAEKNINEARFTIEERNQDLERIAERITIKQGDLEAKQLELETIVESTSTEEEALKERKEACSKLLDERSLSAYERIRNSTHNHLAVVTLFPKGEDGTYGNACGGCFHTVTPQRLIEIASGKKLVICEHCGRIIVDPEI